MKLSLLAASVLLALSACAPTRYSYAPVSTTGADLAGASAAVYGMPPESPRGDVRVAMLGIGSVSALGSQETPADAIHVTLAVSNRSEETWTVDPSEQRLTLTMKRQRSDVYATTRDAPRASAVQIPARSTRMIDLYFPLPIQFQKEDAPPPFEVIWTIHIGSRAVVQRTPFQRFIVSPTPEEERDLRKPDDVEERGRPLPGEEQHERRPILPFSPPDQLDPLNGAGGET
jgi:hypothetical protein